MLNIFKQDDRLVIHKKTDPNPSLAAARVARDMTSAGVGQFYAPSDSWHVGRVDKHVLEAWLKEAGVRWDDRAAVAEVLKRKLLDADNQAFRVKDGTF